MDPTLTERDRMRFSKFDVGEELIDMIMDAFIFPVLSPTILVGPLIRTLRHEPVRHSASTAVKLLHSELWDLEKSATLLSELPAATATRIFAAIQIIAASPAMHGEAVNMLINKEPTGARFIPPVPDPPRPGMMRPQTGSGRPGKADGLTYDRGPTANS